jgi:hypothetical protein
VASNEFSSKLKGGKDLIAGAKATIKQQQAISDRQREASEPVLDLALLDGLGC